MTALWIVLGVIAVLAGLMVLPIRVSVNYEKEECKVCLRYGLIFYRFSPEKREKPAKKQKKEKPKPEKAEGGAVERITAQIRHYLDLVRLLWRLAPPVRRTLVIDRLRLRITWGSDDPADQAQHYGQAWALLGTATAALENIFTIKKRDIQALFGEETEFSGQICLHVTLLGLLRVLICYLKNRPKAEEPQPDAKGESL